MPASPYPPPASTASGGGGALPPCPPPPAYGAEVVGRPARMQRSNGSWFEIVVAAYDVQRGTHRVRFLGPDGVPHSEATYDLCHPARLLQWYDGGGALLPVGQHPGAPPSAGRKDASSSAAAAVVAGAEAAATAAAVAAPGGANPAAPSLAAPTAAIDPAPLPPTSSVVSIGGEQFSILSVRLSAGTHPPPPPPPPPPPTLRLRVLGSSAAAAAHRAGSAAEAEAAAAPATAGGGVGSSGGKAAGRAYTDVALLLSRATPTRLALLAGPSDAQAPSPPRRPGQHSVPPLPPPPPLFEARLVPIHLPPTFSGDPMPLPLSPPPRGWDAARGALTRRDDPTGMLLARVELWWPRERAWFGGRVTRYDGRAGAHYVRYDDGDARWYNLDSRDVRLAPDTGGHAAVGRRVAVGVALDGGGGRVHRGCVCATVVGYEPLTDLHVLRYDAAVVTPAGAYATPPASGDAPRLAGGAAAAAGFARADRLYRSLLYGGTTGTAVLGALARGGIVGVDAAAAAGTAPDSAGWGGGGAGTGVSPPAVAVPMPVAAVVPTLGFEEATYLPARAVQPLVEADALPASLQLMGRRVAVHSPSVGDGGGVGGYLRAGTVTHAWPAPAPLTGSAGGTEDATSAVSRAATRGMAARLAAVLARHSGAAQRVLQLQPPRSSGGVDGVAAETVRSDDHPTPPASLAVRVVYDDGAIACERVQGLAFAWLHDHAPPADDDAVGTSTPPQSTHRALRRGGRASSMWDAAAVAAAGGGAWWGLDSSDNGGGVDSDAPVLPAPAGDACLTPALGGDGCNGGGVGVVNVGKSCWLGAVLQALAHTTPLAAACLDARFPAAVRVDNPHGMHGRMALGMTGLLLQLWGGQDAVLAVGPPPPHRRRPPPAVAPTLVKALLGERCAELRELRQHDGHEALLALLGGLHEDLAEPDARATSAATDDARVRAQEEAAAVAAAVAKAAAAQPGAAGDLAVAGVACLPPVHPPTSFAWWPFSSRHPRSGDGGGAGSGVAGGGSAVSAAAAGTAGTAPVSDTVAVVVAPTTAVPLVGPDMARCVPRGGGRGWGGAAESALQPPGAPPPNPQLPHDVDAVALAEVPLSATPFAPAPTALAEASSAVSPAQPLASAGASASPLEPPPSVDAPPAPPPTAAVVVETASAVTRLFFVHTLTQLTCARAAHVRTRHGPRGGELLPPLPLHQQQLHQQQQQQQQQLLVLRGRAHAPAHGGRVFGGGGFASLLSLLPRHASYPPTEPAHPPDSRLTLEGCLAACFATDVATGACDACDAAGRPGGGAGAVSTRPWLAAPLPPVLVIQLKRFEYRGIPGAGGGADDDGGSGGGSSVGGVSLGWGGAGGSGLVKISDPVTFPTRGLDMAAYVFPGLVAAAEGGGDYSVFDLYAAVLHAGSAEGGHYTAYAKSMGVGHATAEALAALSGEEGGGCNEEARAVLARLVAARADGSTALGLRPATGPASSSDADADAGSSGAGGGVVSEGAPVGVPVGDGWRYFDDASVRPATESELGAEDVASRAYLLFYARRGF